MNGAGPRLATVRDGLPFADALAEAWFAGAGRDPVANGDGTILVPNGRLARTLAERFVSAGGGAALLVPRIEAIGGADEGSFFQGGLVQGGEPAPAPAIAPMRRLATLTRLVLAHQHARGVRFGADRAWALAEALASLIDEAARAGVDLAAALPGLVPDELAGHWQVTLEFLGIVTAAWPDALSAAGLTDPAIRHVRVLDLRARAWRDAPPPGRLWFAGFAAATPALGRLARVVAHLPRGLVVFPGLDPALDDAARAALPDGHPQAGMRDLLAMIGASGGEVATLGGAPDRARAGRAALLSRAMLPADAIGTWRDPPAPEASGIELLVAADEREEALAIAMALRDAVQEPGRRAALVTPDRALARRVAAELGRFGVVADDSAGERLAETPPAAFLRLVAQNAAEGFPPVPLLALLKHPLAAFGMEPARTRRLARLLERARLRGPRPPRGLEGLRRDDGWRAALAPLLDGIERAFAPLAAAFARPALPPRALALALVETAEAAARTDRAPGAEPLWAEEEGDALARHLAEWSDSLEALGPERPEVLPGLLDASFGAARVHGRRALRGRDALETHPRIAIWGLLESRGQTADLVVLGGLVEGVWPSATDPGPWMGRPMRARIGLPSPEAAISAQAHDFAALAAAGGRVLLSRPKRRERAPAVPSRFLARLEACLAASGASLPGSPCLAWARGLDRPDRVRPCAPPAPRPPVAARPRRLSVTEIGTWLVDPYAIYAKHVLGLRPLPALEEEADRAVLGTLVHDGIARAFADAAAGTATLDAATIEAALSAALDARGDVRPGVAAWWRPRLARMAAWVAEREGARRAEHGAPAHLAVEVSGRCELDGPAGLFTLTGRADRIERRPDGALAILDYKTGTVPRKDAVVEGWDPQLPLEATMAACGAFGSEFAGAAIGELSHWKLSGGRERGAIASIDDADALARATEGAWIGLERRIAEFDDPDTAYLSEPDPAHRDRFGEYATLARVAEWRLVGGSGEDGA